MQTEKGAAVESKKAESKANVAGRVKFVVRASLREEYVDADFVHSIFGRIFTRPEDDGDEEDSGCIRASLVQFGEALDHGISTARIGDGIEGNISDYWECLFDVDTGYWKEEIQDDYEVSGCDLLIIDCVEIHPRLRGKGIGLSAIERTIDIFGAGCGLVACKPWPLQFTPAFTRDRKALKRLKAPDVGRDEALRKLREYWSRLGFWPLGETGIYLLSMTQRGASGQGERCKDLTEAASRLASSRGC